MVVEYKIPDGRSNYGVATTWLRFVTKASLNPIFSILSREKVPVGEGEERICPKVPAYVRRSQFRLPNRPQVQFFSFSSHFYLFLDPCDNDWAWHRVGSLQRLHPGKNQPLTISTKGVHSIVPPRDFLPILPYHL